MCTEPCLILWVVGISESIINKGFTINVRQSSIIVEYNSIMFIIVKNLKESTLLITKGFNFKLKRKAIISCVLPEPGAPIKIKVFFYKNKSLRSLGRMKSLKLNLVIKPLDFK